MSVKYPSQFLSYTEIPSNGSDLGFRAQLLHENVENVARVSCGKSMSYYLPSFFRSFFRNVIFAKSTFIIFG